MKSIESYLLYSIRDYKGILNKKTNSILYLPIILFLFFAGDALELSFQEGRILQYLGIIGINSLLARELQKYIARKAYKLPNSISTFHTLKYLLTNLILFSPSLLIILYLLSLH